MGERETDGRIREQDRDCGARKPVIHDLSPRANFGFAISPVFPEKGRKIRVTIMRSSALKPISGSSLQVARGEEGK
ncbi:hypothetical protein AKJ51_01670 [candidate division MSBL1 archaeon SCGC-AAA382A20]|uniref:Uncharacterized protein n=1 Tax=candidate division MSBL1 archaeon SCGC-AAA382A20 TaxID=1698280 RepID=A0A133VLH6_9EURY|nr:hypothetical protein AKJ51_01670 [candidate division MSBL1 archaeon SCGC-AAA382A20]